jgi:NCAIR mutase (PurE)-related protein
MIKLFAIASVPGIAELDVGREMRRGVPEIILGEGKSPEQISALVRAAYREVGQVVVSRLDRRAWKRLDGLLPQEMPRKYHERARLLTVGSRDEYSTGGRVGVVTAGTGDIPVAEEVVVIARWLGCEAYAYYDVGVAGLHRLSKALRELVKKDVDVVVVAAGAEGALPSVLTGLVDIPVIGLPTSSGFGYGGKGEAALLSMLQSCPLGLTVVNIDGGVAAGVVAALIANRAARFRGQPRGADAKG